MSRQRLKKWDDRAKTYLGLPAEQRARFRAQFRKREFDAAVVRIGNRFKREYDRQVEKKRSILSTKGE